MIDTSVEKIARRDEVVVQLSSGGLMTHGTRYLTSNLWDSFCDAYPTSSNIPVYRYWAFGVFVRAYFRVKTPVW
jgi:hypothetical protein